MTAYSGKEELGQGISTAQTQLVAEELCVPIQRVKLIYCDTAMTPDQAHTSGSQSHPANFNQSNLAQAGATAREALFRLASQRLGVPVDQLTAKDGAIGNAREEGAYGELIGGTKFNLTVDAKAKEKTRASGPYSASRRQIPICPRSLPANLNLCIMCAYRACSTAGW